ncbi:serine/threonine-protein kinase [Lentisphaera marina]|uniref:serine/threonine-protein kinase n=1 Tax=Lentisphaera marina TaxID=1111041 RepID=UPI0023657E74|nr:serine/threonine-protein kinase [Lentisphaera marina]MDD7987257.1 serine/threonine-protein kinase [Lentisphaera marina]
MNSSNDSLDIKTEFTNEFAQLYNYSDDEQSFEELNPIYAEVDAAEVRYTDFEEIGSGGMKTVYRVYDRKSDRHVAMAQLHSDAPRDCYESFLREARLTAGLQHPNIIPVYDVGILDNAPFFTMELKGGKSLSEIISSKADGSVGVTSSDLLKIFLKICDAIAYAHSKNVLHLDLKPGNIQIGEYGEVTVCDWGLAKVLGSLDDDDESLYFNPDLLNNMTLAGEIKGTPGYMAPEQVTPDGDKNFQTDIYALGAMLYVLLTLDNPSDENVKTTLERTCNGTLFDFSKTCNTIPESLKAVVMKATATAPQARYQNLTSLGNEVQQYLSGFATTAEDAHFLKQLLLLLKRNQRVSLILCTALSLILGLTLYSVNEITKSEKATREALIISKKQRDFAQESLDQYRNEKRYSTSLAKSYEQAVFGQSLLFRSSGVYSNRTKVNDYWRVIKELDKVLEKNPSNKKAIYDKGKLLLIMQRFDESAKCYRLNPDHGEVAATLVEEFADKYPGGKIKKAEVIIDFIRRIKEQHIFSRAPLAEKMMVYDSLVRQSLKHHSRIVREVITIFNRKWDNALFEYDSKERSLIIGGKYLRNFRPNFYHGSNSNILRTLQIDSLTIKSAEFQKLENVSKLHLNTLDIRDTAVSTVPGQKYLQLISTIICRPDQFSADERAKFPKHIKLIEK